MKQCYVIYRNFIYWNTFNEPLQTGEETTTEAKQIHKLAIELKERLISWFVLLPYFNTCK